MQWLIHVFQICGIVEDIHLALPSQNLPANTLQGQFHQSSSVFIQEELAPFAMENPGCLGNETRLMDCPEFDPTQDGLSADYDYRFFELFRDYSNTQPCDPYSGTFATVACGLGDAAGTFQMFNASRNVVV